MSESVPDKWITIRLGDVAEEISERVDTPSKSGYERFVGLEHLDSGELTVRRWGSTADLLSSMKLFRSGDILIGRRNAYLKRASKVDFDGVCSGDAYVIRERQEKIAEGLLPIILNSNSFWEYTIAHASGTMSKRAKWRDLAEYSFQIPPLNEQRRIATTVWAAEDYIVTGERFVAAAERAKQVLMRELFSKGIGHTEFQNADIGLIPRKWKVPELRTILSEKIINGYSGRESNTGTIVKILTLSSVTNNEISEKYTKEIKVDPQTIEEYWIKKGDIYIGRGNTPELVGLATLNQNEDSFGVFPDLLIRIRPNLEVINSKFLIEYLLSQFVRTYFSRNSKGTAGSMRKIDQKIIEKLLVPLPPLHEQQQIATISTRCDETIAAASTNVAATKALKRRLINDLLTPNT